MTSREKGKTEFTLSSLSTVTSPFSLRAEGSAEETILVLGETPDALMMRSAEEEEKRKRVSEVRPSIPDLVS